MNLVLNDRMELRAALLFPYSLALQAGHPLKAPSFQEYALTFFL